MKKYILLISSIFIIIGCNNKKLEPKKQPEIQKKAIEISFTEEIKKDVKEKIVLKKIKKVSKVKKKKLYGTYYRMVTNSIEVFTYKGRLSNNKIVDTKLINPFYIKGNIIRIEKIYDSVIGDRYGKISGKWLFVSMDDLTLNKK
ncbi:MAG: hypothetical protein GY932_02990 [Arcobacter sp.]|nr:hypothetical protein [Arcobacter sp.]